MILQAKQCTYSHSQAEYRRAKLNAVYDRIIANIIEFDLMHRRKVAQRTASNMPERWMHTCRSRDPVNRRSFLPSRHMPATVCRNESI